LNEPLSDEGASGGHEGTSVVVMDISKGLCGTCNGDATR
jgi:hypothetical protein